MTPDHIENSDLRAITHEVIAACSPDAGPIPGDQHPHVVGAAFGLDAGTVMLLLPGIMKGTEDFLVTALGPSFRAIVAANRDLIRQFASEKLLRYVDDLNHDLIGLQEKLQVP